MAWHSRDTIAVVELVFYIPFSFVSAFVCFRHGFSRSSGWLYTLILCLIRVIGGILQFVSHNDHSTGLLQTIMILDSVGLSPLLLATLGLLSRFVDFVNAASTPRFTTRHFRVLQLVLFLGMILAITGGTHLSVGANGSYTVPTTSKVGYILYIIGYLGIALLFLLSVHQTSAIPSKERRVPLAIALALPFILVRLIYSALSVFLHNDLFSIVSGSSAVRFGMAIIEEFIVVALYVLLGLLVDKLDASTKGPITSRPWQAPKGRTVQKPTVDHEAQYLKTYPAPTASPSPSYPQTAGVAR